MQKTWTVDNPSVGLMPSGDPTPLMPSARRMGSSCPPLRSGHDGTRDLKSKSPQILITSRANPRLPAPRRRAHAISHRTGTELARAMFSVRFAPSTTHSPRWSPQSIFAELNRVCLNRPGNLPLQAKTALKGRPYHSDSLEKIWSGRRDSNPRHQPWQGCALPLSYARPLGTHTVPRRAIILKAGGIASADLGAFGRRRAYQAWRSPRPAALPSGPALPAAQNPLP